MYVPPQWVPWGQGSIWLSGIGPDELTIPSPPKTHYSAPLSPISYGCFSFSVLSVSVIRSPLPIQSSHKSVWIHRFTHQNHRFTRPIGLSNQIGLDSPICLQNLFTKLHRSLKSNQNQNQSNLLEVGTHFRVPSEAFFCGPNSFISFHGFCCLRLEANILALIGRPIIFALISLDSFGDSELRSRMGTQEEIARYANISRMDDDFLAPFLSGSQNTSMPIQESCPEVEIVTPNPTKRGGNFSVDEDKLLVSAWLNISMDAVEGTNQRLDKFWKKIWQYFCKNNTYGTTRSASSLKSRWGNINRETSRFAGIMAKIEARNPSGVTYEDKLKDAKELYKESPAQTTGKKSGFAFEHCWVELKNQPKWNMPKERSKGFPQTPSSIDEGGSNDDDTVELERPIGRKAEKAKRKRTDGDKGFDDYLAKKLQYMEESHEQDNEALRIKADRVRVDAQRADIEKERADIEKERLRLETSRETHRVDIENERLRLETIREEGRIMTLDTSSMNDKESRYFENLKDKILARQQLE
nr:glutathione s-transferase t3 [Quercus suber]